MTGHDGRHHDRERTATVAEVPHHRGQITLELSTSRSQIYALLRSGELKGIQIGGRGQWRIERVRLEEYLSARRIDARLRRLPIYPPT